MNISRSTLVSCSIVLMVVLPMADCKRVPVEKPLESVEKRESPAAMTKEEYFEMMHLAAPGDDWRVMERQNHAVAVQRRLAAQKSAPAQGAWRELGSRNLAGRIHAAALSTDGRTLYAGADRGGVWKGTPDGTNWEPISDQLYGGAHEICVVPGPGGQDILIRIWNDWNNNAFVDRTEDGGQTWTMPAGLGDLTAAKRILLVDDTVFLLVRVGYSNWHLLTSKDLGASFTQCRALNTEGDIWTPRTHLGPLYLIDDCQIHETTDGGATWNAVGNPMPVSGHTMVMAGSEQPKQRFYIGLRDSKDWQLWETKDLGQYWRHVGTITAYYFDYWQTLAASCTDNDLVAEGGLEVILSRSGGRIWEKVNGWGSYYLNPAEMLHADIPGLYAFPSKETPCDEVWYIGTDGGIYDSHDQMKTVRNLSLSGLGVSQYYSTHTSRRNPDIVLAGSQDQGYQRAVIQGTPPPGSGPWLDFEQLEAGDYGHMTSSNGAHDLVYSVHPYFFLVHSGEENPQTHYVFGNAFPPGETFPWMPYIVADPLDPEAFFFCATRLYRYTRAPGTAYKYNYTKHSNKNFQPNYLTALAFSPLDPDRAYAATNMGKLFFSNDRGVTWTQSSNKGPKASVYYGSTLIPSPRDVDVCWVAGSGYSTAPVWRTDNGGRTWSTVSNGLPKTLVYCMCEAPDQSGRFFCGTENGAWVLDPDTLTWSDLLGAEAPITTYWTCEAVPARNLIRFGTYSRGIWDYHLNSPGYFPYGELKGGPHVLSLDNHAQPHIGQPTTFEISGCQPGAKGMLAFSRASGEHPVLGGTLLLDPQTLFSIPFNADNEGRGKVTLRIPNDPAYKERQLYFQAFAEDPGMLKGWSLSHGLRAVVGD